MRGERPREGLGAAVAATKGVLPTFSVDGTFATVSGFVLCPRVLFLPRVGTDEVT